MKSPEDLRVEMSIQSTLNDASIQSKRINGKDRLALQEEFLEWLSLETEDIEVLHMDHFNYW